MTRGNNQNPGWSEGRAVEKNFRSIRTDRITSGEGKGTQKQIGTRTKETGNDEGETTELWKLAY